MNEQLIVKNFGPITDATVDFKRVTVFIGPTGGGKSTLAKLAAVFRDDNWLREPDLELKDIKFDDSLDRFLIFDYIKQGGNVHWQSAEDVADYHGRGLTHDDSKRRELFEAGMAVFDRIAKTLPIPEPEYVFARATDTERAIMSIMDGTRTDVHYIPADRAFAAALDSGLAGLVLNDIALPESLLTFLNDFQFAKQNLPLFPLQIPFLEIAYRMIDKQAQIDLGNDGVIELRKGASGIQSVVPMMLVINNAAKKRNKRGRPHSFIIEEPELNLYPTAQQGLLNWLVEKCTKGENDLTITTHSPYILSHLNLLLYAYQVAEKHPDRKEAVAAIVPEASWINPKEFACYQVENGGVTSLVSEDLGLIDDNGLDGLSGDAADAFDNLIRLSKAVARK